MKKKTIVITTAILCMPSFYLQAGLRIGVKAGVNLAKAAFNTDAVKPDNFTGFQVGPIIEYASFTGFGVDAALLYSESGIKFTEGFTITKYNEKVNTLDIPIQLKQKFSFAKKLGCYWSAGPYISFILNTQGTINQNYNMVITEWKSKQFGVGVNLGAGLELLKHLQIGVNYQIALNNDYRNNISVINYKGDLLFSGIKAKTRIWSLTASYFF